jgi:Ca-activated chloride channel family protein
MNRTSQIGNFLLIAMAFACWTSTTFAQGVLLHDNHRLPRPGRPVVQPVSSYKIKELIINARIQDQVARTQVTQTFVNTGSRQMEVCFAFPLPYDGAIDQLTFMVDGKEFEGKLMPAKEARKIYEGYIRRNQDPALLEWIGTGMFKTSVFPVPPGAERKVTLKYSQLLRKDQKLTDFLFPLSTAKYTSTPIDLLKFDIAISSKYKIKSVYSPTHPVNVERSGEKSAKITLEAKNRIPSTDFRLFFDTNEGKLGASVLTYWPEDADEGFFLMLASPQIKNKAKERPKKTVVFVADRSGSMSGKKIEQAREALRFVLNNLHEGDLFNIVAYDSDVESFKPELQKYNDKSRVEALAFVDGIYAGGSTAIDAALKTSLSMIQDRSQPNYIVFLTDGRPTAGETNEMKIVENSRKINALNARVISLGVGYDVNSRLLDRLTSENRGQSEYVRPDEDLETHVSRLYNKIASPVLTDVKIDYMFDEVASSDRQPVNRIYPKKVFEIFTGQQLVVAGRYKTSGAAKIRISGKVGSKSQKFSFPAEFAKKSYNDSNSFVEKLWAMRRIGEIIDEMDLKGKNDELINELVGLSTKHGIITPYTSFLADDQGPRNRLTSGRREFERARIQLGRLDESGGRAGFAQRDFKNGLKNASQLPSADFFGESLDLAQSNVRPYAANSTRMPGRGRNAGGGGLGGVRRGTDSQSKSMESSKKLAKSSSSSGGGIIINDIDNDRKFSVDSVKVIGKNTIYRRGNLWIDASAKDIDINKDKAKITEVKRFSKEYFDLTENNSKSENAVLALQKDDQQVLIELRGKVYLIQ